MGKRMRLVTGSEVKEQKVIMTPQAGVQNA
jgi:hypothetical protein